MADWSTLATFTAACIAIIVVPGPTVTVIIANSVRAGSRAGLLNAAGTQLGLIIMVGILALGLEAVMRFMADTFIYLKVLGAAYLVWLGFQLWQSNGTLLDSGSANARKRSNAGYFWQGFIVIWSNPKALFFFGAFIPQFIVPGSNAAFQTVVLGLIFMIVGAVFDGLYALAAGKAGSWMSRTNIALVERISGTCLIGGGLWLAMSRRA